MPLDLNHEQIMRAAQTPNVSMKHSVGHAHPFQLEVPAADGVEIRQSHGLTKLEHAACLIAPTIYHFHAEHAESGRIAGEAVRVAVAVLRACNEYVHQEAKRNA